MHPRSMHFEVYQDAAGEWRWRLVAANGKIVAASEAYVSKSNAKRATGDVLEGLRLSYGSFSNEDGELTKEID